MYRQDTILTFTKFLEGNYNIYGVKFQETFIQFSTTYSTLFYCMAKEQTCFCAVMPGLGSPKFITALEWIFAYIKITCTGCIKKRHT